MGGPASMMSAGLALVRLPISQYVMAGSWSVGSAISLVNDTPADSSELTMTPASTTVSTWLPRAAWATTITRSTVPNATKNASTETPKLANPSKMATAAPNAAPCDAPKMSGETSGFWNVPW